MAMRIIAVMLVLVLSSGTSATRYIIGDANEPTTDEVLAATGIYIDDPNVVATEIWRLLNTNGSAIDEWIPDLREREHRAMVNAVFARARQDVPDPEKAWILPVGKYAQQFRTELAESRLKNPARQVDALLRRLGAIGLEADKAVNFAKRARTDLGRWKAYAAAQEILARVDIEVAADIAPEIGPDVYPLLLLDLEPQRAGELARRYLQLVERDDQSPLEPRLWLAWSLSHTHPDQAVKIFAEGLVSFDPALRLLAGRGLSRLTNVAPGFPFTSPPVETEAARKTWLTAINPRPPKEFDFPDPTSLPLIVEQHGTRVDLYWLNHDAKVVKAIEDIWPMTRFVMADGSCYAALWQRGYALIAPDGTPLARVHPGRSSYAEGVAPHGGLLVSSQPGDGGSGIAEYAPDGRALWALPIESRFLSPAGYGRFVVMQEGQITVIDRRGDIVWNCSPSPYSDVRSAQLVAPDTLLIVGQHAIGVVHRTEGSKAHVEGFTSATDVRYHPTLPWVVSDAGQWFVVTDPATGGRNAFKEPRWNNDSSSYWSKWIPKGQWQPQ